MSENHKNNAKHATAASQGRSRVSHTEEFAVIRTVCRFHA